MERYIGFAYLVVAFIGYLVTVRLSRQKARQAATSGAKSFFGVAPTFLAVFGLVGLLEVFVPPSIIERVLGAEGGVLSLFAGGAVGSVAAGPPVAAYPIAASLLAGGAWMPAVAAFIVSWTLVGFVSLPFEASMFGWRFALARNGFSFVFALLIGVAMGAIV